MEAIYIDKTIDTDRLRIFLGSLFPKLQVFHYDFSEGTTEKLNSENDNKIFFNFQSNLNRKEFQVELSLFRTPDSNCEERALYIAKKISDYFSIRTLVPISHYNEDDSPYLNAMFHNGDASLIDDSNFDWADGTAGELKLIGSYIIPSILFDEQAVLKKPATNSG